MSSGIFWKIRLFEGPTLEPASGDSPSVIRFRSDKVAALLAYLAIHHEKLCTRHELIEALWPDELDTSKAQNRLRVTLASLRKQLEPEGFGFGSVLDTTIAECVRLRPGSTWCDFRLFEDAYAAKQYEIASTVAQGKLLPGSYDEWVAPHQLRAELLVDEISTWAKPNETVIEPWQEPVRNEHRLPYFLTSFIGRSSELSLLKQLLINQRLVTLVGPGGVGKTRLSVEACKDQAARAIFVPLAECQSGAEIWASISTQLGLGSQFSTTALQHIVDNLLGSPPVILILDNAEHIADEVAEIVRELTSALPHLTFIVSSRQPLHVVGEQVVRLDPFTLEEEAHNLFVDRAKLSRPDFKPSSANKKIIDQLCERLDRMPLAIELAAAQISYRSLDEILDQIQSGILELKSKLRTLNARHRSLRSVIESSFDLLGAEEQDLIGKVSVFWGGFTSHAARHLVGSAADGLLDELVSHSLVVAQTNQSSSRFSLLEIVRQAAQERLSPSEFDANRTAHAEYFVGIAGQIDEDDLRTLWSLSNEWSNLTAALSVTDPSEGAFWQASKGAIMFAFIRGEHRQALPLIDEHELKLSNCPDYRLRRDWRNAAIQVLPDLGMYEKSEKIIAELISEARTNSDDHGLSLGSIALGLVQEREGHITEGIETHRIALDLARKVGQKSLLESALSHLGGSLCQVMRLPDATETTRLALLNEAEGCIRELIGSVSDWSRRYPLAHMLLGNCLLYQGKVREATQALDQAEEAANQLGIRSVLMYVAKNRATLAEGSGDMAESAVQTALYDRLRLQIGIRF